MESLSRTESAPWDFLRNDSPHGDGRRVGQAAATRAAAEADRVIADAQAGEFPLRHHRNSKSDFCLALESLFLSRPQIGLVWDSWILSLYFSAIHQVGFPRSRI